MKFSLIRSASMLALTLGLASCGGGGDDTYTVAGSVTDLVYPGLVLTNNGADLAVAPPATPSAGSETPFAFPNKLEYGDTYSVTVKTNPAHQSCNVHPSFPLSTADTAGRLASINARILCTVNSYGIGGEVTGLTAANTGLVLANGSTGGTVPVSRAATDTTTAAIQYVLPFPVTYGVTYGVTVLTQPVGRFCTVSNPTGVMGDAPVTNINVNCVPT